MAPIKLQENEDPPYIIEALRLIEIVKKQVPEYEGLVVADRKDWNKNGILINKCFSWGYNIGTLVLISNDSSSDYEKVFKGLKPTMNDLNAFYKKHRDPLDLSQMKARTEEQIVNAADKVFEKLAALHRELKLTAADEFEETCKKFDPVEALAIMYDIGKPENWGKYEKLLCFFSFHLACVSMFRLGLQHGLKKTNEAKRTRSMYQEQIPIFSSLAKLYETLAVALASEKKN